MKLTTILSVAIAAIVIAACSSSKKSASSAAPSSAATATVAAVPAPAPSPSSTVTGPAPRPRFGNGIMPPGNDELNAIQAKYPGTTMQTLTDGHAIYTGACTNCHTPMSIYRFSENQWPSIINDMAGRAKLNDTQKDAVYKYVMSIKATQPQ